MKFIIPIFIVVFAISFLSCSSDVSKETESVQGSGTQTKEQSKFPAHIAENKSTVTAEVEGVYIRDKTDFFIKARILKVEEDPAYLSLALQGASYILVPSFQLDNNKNVAGSDKNKSLESLTKLRVGDTFKAIIYYQQYYGWFIEKTL